jgi:hypothetical protein
MILSTMESEGTSNRPYDARDDLEAADRARERLSGHLELPRGLHPALGLAVAVQIATAGVGLAERTAVGVGLMVAGLVVFAAVAGWFLHRFRQLNGVRVSGLAGRVVLGTGITSSVAYVVAMTGATWAASSSQWALVGVAAVAGGAGWVLGASQWWAAYRGDPATHAQGPSRHLLAVLALVACLGLVVLVVVG